MSGKRKITLLRWKWSLTSQRTKMGAGWSEWLKKKRWDDALGGEKRKCGRHVRGDIWLIKDIRSVQGGIVFVNMPDQWRAVRDWGSMKLKKVSNKARWCSIWRGRDNRAVCCWWGSRIKDWSNVGWDNEINCSKTRWSWAQQNAWSIWISVVWSRGLEEM